MSATDEGPADAAIRMLAGDDGTNYDDIAIALHWATAALVFVQFALSQTWSWFGRPVHHSMVVAHMSFGIILTVIIVARIVWRLILGHHIPTVVSGLVEIASKAVHYILYALLASEAVLGFTLRWSGGEEISFFGLTNPSPFDAWSRATNHQLGILMKE
jgi:cytochrome b561